MAFTARTVLFANAGFSISCGLLMVFFADDVAAQLFARIQSWQLPLLLFSGMSLVFFGLGTIVIASSAIATGRFVIGIIAADVIWVLGSAVILLAFKDVFSASGLVLCFAIAAIVALLAIGQYRGAKQSSVLRGQIGMGRMIGLGAAGLGVVVSSGLATLGVSSALAQNPSAPVGNVYEVGGERLHMVCKGQGGPTMIVDFGVTNWSLHWASIQDEIAQSTRICGYDRAGFGASGPIQNSLTPNQLVANLQGVIEASGEKGPFVLVGHSFGGYVVRLYHHAFPEDVVGLALVEAAHEEQCERFPAQIGEMMSAGFSMLGIARTLSIAGGLQFMDIPLTDPLPTKQQRDQLARAMQTTQYYDSTIQHFGVVPALAEAVSKTDPLNDLPLLVVSAGKSADAYCGKQFGVDVPCAETQRVWSELQAELANLSSESKHLILPNALHHIQLDEQASVANALVGFATSLR